jgi:hypothetical protein
MSPSTTAGIQVLYILQNTKKNPPKHVLQNKCNSQPKIKMISKSKKLNFDHTNPYIFSA